MALCLLALPPGILYHQLAFRRDASETEIADLRAEVIRLESLVTVMRSAAERIKPSRAPALASRVTGTRPTELASEALSVTK